MQSELDNLKSVFKPEEIDKRIEQIEKAISLFTLYHNDKNNEIKFIDNAATEIALKYFEWSNVFVKPFIEEGNRLNAYKIASCTELVIVKMQPIINQCKTINVEFAIFCVMNIIESIRQPSLFNFNTGRDDLNAHLDLFEKNHHNYMELINIVDAPPIISNAAFWEVLHLFYHYRFQTVG